MTGLHHERVQSLRHLSALGERNAVHIGQQGPFSGVGIQTVGAPERGQDDDGVDPEYDLGLDLIIAGLEQRLGRASRTGQPADRPS